MSKEPIFAGIDPGTTAAYAILNLDGKLIKVSSGKEISLRNLVSDISEKGVVIAVGTDKAKVPETIEKFSASTGSKLATPKTDLKIEEKRAFTEGFLFANDHEMDAIASAVFAYNSFRGLIEKVRKFANDNQDDDFLFQLIILVLRYDIPIRNAISVLQQKNEEDRIIRKVIDEKVLSKNDFIILHNKCKQLQKESYLLKKQNIILKEELVMLREENLKYRRLNKRESTLKSKKIDALFGYKEIRIREFEAKLRKEITQREILMKKYEELNHFLAESSACYLLKRLDNLGIQELERKRKKLSITEGDILLVRNPSIYNEKSIDLLRNKVSIILYEEKMSKRPEGFPFLLIRGQDLNLKRLGDFALVNKRDLDKKMEKQNILNRIVEEYKQSRK